MKKLFRFLLYALPSVLLLSACSPANGLVARVVQLPADARLLILGLITSGLTALFAFAFTKWGVDLRGFIPELAATLSAIVIVIIEFVLGMLKFIPDDILLTIIHLIVLAITGYGAAWFLSKVKTPGYRSFR